MYRQSTIRRTLYLGLRPPLSTENREVVHFPIISIQPTKFQSERSEQVKQHFSQFTAAIFTSQTTVELLQKWLDFFSLPPPSHWQCFSIGKKTSSVLEKLTFHSIHTATTETAEGLIQCLDRHNFNSSFILYPHSEKSRPVLSTYLQNKKIPHIDWHLYTISSQFSTQPPSLDTFDEVIFTSPSTVESFFKIYSSLPYDLSLVAIGPITQSYLNNFLFFL